MQRTARSPEVHDRIGGLVEHTIRLVGHRPAEGWDTSTAALRLVSFLRASEALRPVGLSLPDLEGRLRNFIAAHQRPLAWGAVAEPAGNHELVNVAGRAALHFLLDDGSPLPHRMSSDFVGRFERQFLPDGGHVERSPHYQAQVLSLATVICEVDSRRGGALAACLGPALTKARGALAGMLAGGAPFRLGDISRTFSGKTPVEDVTEGLGGVDFPRERSVSMPHFGIAVVRWRTGDLDFSLVVDAGEMGYSLNPGHGHADSLSFSLLVNGHELITDPGTYLYADTEAATWFKLAEAHATIRWPHRPSCVLSRFFRWSRIMPPPNLVRTPAGPLGTALHAVQRWRRGEHWFEHARSWIPLPRGLAIRDRVASQESRPALSRMPLHPQATLATDGKRGRIGFPGGSAAVRSWGSSVGPYRERYGGYAAGYGEREDAVALEWPIETSRGGASCWTFVRVQA
ncbi:MAG TPA: heparinase II/III family protein [Longimicrobiaceae bacterium]|nr:heparinase II/III family protein [Longimicrobiaceae bacterium]